MLTFEVPAGGFCVVFGSFGFVMWVVRQLWFCGVVDYVWDFGFPVQLVDFLCSCAWCGWVICSFSCGF